MGHLVQRMVERRNGGNAAQGIALGIDAALLAMGCQIAGEDLAVVLQAEGEASTKTSRHGPLRKACP
jgi:hypothetical protein